MQKKRRKVAKQFVARVESTARNSTQTAQTIVYLVRHGQPVSHDENGGLTDVGRTQALRLAKFLDEECGNNSASEKRALLVVSPTARTLETADPIAQKLKAHPLSHRAFIEQYLVDSKSVFRTPEFLARHVAAARILRAFWHIVDANRGKRIIIVTHGNVIRVLIGKLCGETFAQMSYKEVPCGSVTKVSVVGREVKVDAPKEIETL